MIERRQYILYASGAVIAALVVWVFALTGSPATQRKLAEDKMTLMDVECIACYAERAACKHPDRAYPAAKSELLNNDVSYCYHNNLRCNTYYTSSNTGHTQRFSGIQYSVEDGKVKLCARFNFDSNEQKMLRAEWQLNQIAEELREYKSGEQCFVIAPRDCPKKKD